jgi:hypothetical protein
MSSSNRQRWLPATATAWRRWSWPPTLSSSAPAPLKALFQRACELGVLVGGAERTSHVFGRRISCHYQGNLQTVLIHREAGHPLMRWYYQSSFGK